MGKKLKLTFNGLFIRMMEPTKKVDKINIGFIRFEDFRRERTAGDSEAIRAR